MTRWRMKRWMRVGHGREKQQAKLLDAPGSYPDRKPDRRIITRVFIRCEEAKVKQLSSGRSRNWESTGRHGETTKNWKDKRREEVKEHGIGDEDRKFMRPSLKGGASSSFAFGEMNEWWGKSTRVIEIAVTIMTSDDFELAKSNRKKKEKGRGKRELDWSDPESWRCRTPVSLQNLL